MACCIDFTKFERISYRVFKRKAHRTAIRQAQFTDSAKNRRCYERTRARTK